MGQESDDIVSLPAPPPPNPAARRSAIDTALRKFEGIEEPAPKRARPSAFGWAAYHRRLTGGLVTAALIAVIGIPAMQIAIRNQPTDIASERAEPGLATADVEAVPDNAAIVANEPPPGTAAPVPIARNEPVAAPAESPAKPKEERLGFAGAEPEPKARSANIAPMLSAPASPKASVSAVPPPAPPPPPPPPPPPMAEREAADAVAAQSENIVVTGSAVRRQNMKSAAPAAAEEAQASFDEKLRSAFQSNNRSAILALIAFPLKVDFNGDTRTYRTRSDVDRDFARIFTGDVRASVLNGQPGRHLTFGPGAGNGIKIRAVRL